MHLFYDFCRNINSWGGNRSKNLLPEFQVLLYKHCVHSIQSISICVPPKSCVLILFLYAINYQWISILLGGLLCSKSTLHSCRKICKQAHFIALNRYKMSLFADFLQSIKFFSKKHQ